jgi:uncharacterized protein (TIGR03437 family)
VVFCASAHTQIITTIAGTGWVFPGDGKPALGAPIGGTYGIVADRAGNILYSDPGNGMIHKITPDGMLRVIAGNGLFGFSGDGGPAANASLSRIVYGMTLDDAGNLYFADTYNHRIRKIAPDGIITTVAGSGPNDSPIGSFGGDGGPATSAQLYRPQGICRDAAGNLYIADSGNRRVRKVDNAGIISTVAGNGQTAPITDGTRAVDSALAYPTWVTLDSAGSLHITDSGGARIRKVNAAGIISTVAGGGIVASPGEGQPATSVRLSGPQGLVFDAAGNLYFAESTRVRKVDTTGVITTVAGIGVSGFSGDGGQAIQAQIGSVLGVALDAAGNLLFGDVPPRRLRRVNFSTGIITSIAGGGDYRYSGDGGPATAAVLANPAGLALDAAGNLYVGDAGGGRVRKIAASDGKISTAVGTGLRAFGGEGGPPEKASLVAGYGLAFDAAGNLHFADPSAGRVRKISNNTVNTVAGGGTVFPGEGVDAVIVRLTAPQAIAFDAAGNLYIAGGPSIRKVDANRIITTVAGGTISGFAGDGGPATQARLSSAGPMVFDPQGNLYFCDSGNHRVRKIAPDGTITTIAGDGFSDPTTFQGRFAGDGGPATAASLNRPNGLARDTAGNLYVADSSNYRIRKISPAGIITTIAGDGFKDEDGEGRLAGDGGLATKASFYNPTHIALDAAGNLYIADLSNSRVRKMLVAPPSYALSPGILRFTAPAGTAAVTGQQISVSSAVSGLAFTASSTTASGGNWLSASPAAGVMPGVLAVNVNLAGLPPGFYQGTVTVNAALGSPAVQSVTVELTVQQPTAAQLTVEPGTLSFQGPSRSTALPPQTLRIGNAGSGQIAWTATAATESGGAWLAVSPAQGTSTGGAPVAASVAVNATGLADGAYRGSIRVEGNNETRTVTVSLLISQANQTILLSQSGLVFTGVEGGISIPPQSTGILNIGTGVMNWSAEAQTISGGNWLTVSPSSGASAANSLEIPVVEIGVNLTGVRAGQYSGLVKISAAGAGNSPQFVTVELNVLPPGSRPGVLVRPTGLIFAAREGASSPGSQRVRVAHAALGSVEARGGLLTFDGGTWLEMLPRNTLIGHGNPQQILVQPSITGLRKGIYRAAMTLLFDDGSPSEVVNVLFLVVGASAGASPFAVSGGAGAACAPAAMVAIERSLGNNFTTQVGSPANLELQVLDDCGEPVMDATVTVMFSNGDPPLALANLRNGAYAGTWRPLKSSGRAVATIRVVRPPLPTVEVTASGVVNNNPRAAAVFSGGIVNAASFAPAAPLAPGGIISVFGQNLGSSVNVATAVPLPKTLSDVTLAIGGVDVPLFFAGPGQINAQLPYEMAENSQPQAVVRGLGVLTVPETFTVAAARPGIFTLSQDGKGQGAILNAQGDLVDAKAPAAPGDVVVVYCTGLGAVQPSVVTGSATPSAPLSNTVTKVEARIGGQPAVVHFAGLSPGFVGLYQVNVQIPPGVLGPTIDLALLQNGVPSNTVTLGVK